MQGSAFRSVVRSAAAAGWLLVAVAELVVVAAKYPALAPNMSLAGDESLDISIGDVFPRKLMFSPTGSVSSIKMSSAAAAKPNSVIEREPIRVYCRVKPAPPNDQSCADIANGTSVLLKAPHTEVSAAVASDTEKADSFHFTGAFSNNLTQEDVYMTTAQPLVDSLFEGRNCLLFSYGPTNSGKTYTIEGDTANPGILPRVLDEVFTRSKDIEQKTPGTSIFIWATYLEVYNENVYDLLGANSDNRIPMKIKEENGNVVVKGLREIQIRSLKEAQKILLYGQANRQTAETNVNLDSSRSHSIFNIRLVFQMKRDLENGASETTELSPKFSIVDLAGSERSSRSQTTGLRLKEASNINVSLMTLGRCLEALKWNCDHPNAQPHIVPFRQSKLTRIFQQWFVAQSRMVMLVNVSAATSDFDEMVHALRYGAIAKNIVIRSKVQSRHAITEAPTERDQPTGVSDSSDSTPQSQAPQIDIDEVLLEMQQLRTALYEAETRCAQVEQKVREEVTEEMEAQMKEMDLVFAIRIENERIAVEERFQKKLEIITRENNRRGTVKMKASEAENMIQLEYYKKRCEELQKEHKQALIRMMPGHPSQAEVKTPSCSEEGEGDSEDAALYEAEIMRLSKIVIENEQAMQAKKKELAEVRAQLAAVESAATESCNTAARLEQQNDKMREELAMLKTNLQYAVSEYDKVAAQANALHQQVARMKSESKCSEDSSAALQENARLQNELLAFKAANQSISEMYARKEQQLEKLVLDEKKNLKEFYEQQLMESQVQYQLNLRIEMDALKSQVRHERSYREKAEADRDVQRARVKELLALMKKKAESEARESLQPVADAGDSVRTSSSVPDDAKELIAAMAQDELNSCAAAAAVGQAPKTDQSKSRARRLTSTTVALDDASQPQSASLRESSDILNIDDAPQSDKKAPEKKGFFSRAKGWFSGTKSGAGPDKEDVAPEPNGNGKKKRSAKAAAAAEVEETRFTRARAKAGDS